MTSTGHPWLVADIGGTNCRFGLVRASGEAATDVIAYRCADYPSPEAAAAVYLATIGAREGRRVAPQRVALAVATSVDGDIAQMTNSAWLVSRPRLAEALGAKQVLLLNDFEALALALPGLRDEDVHWIGSARPDRSLPMAVIGPGTGLGVSVCVPADGHWIAVAAEGGHVTAAPADDFESEVLREMRREHAHVSAERALSGIGLPVLHRAVCRVRGAPDETLAAEEITRRAFEAHDPLCMATLDTFCAMLGTFAGNVALTVGARGGLFIAGGIAQKLGAAFIGPRFRARFEAKGRFSGYMTRIATGVIAVPYAALAGAAQALAQTRPASRPAARR